MILIAAILINFCALTFVASQKYIEYPHNACSFGEVVENDCNYCICNNKYVYECYVKQCDNKIVSAIKTKTEEQKCEPRMIYVREDVVCICNKHGQWPHQKCENLLQNLINKDASSLKRCEPDSYVKVECNMCRCNSKGEIDREYCTKNNCTQIYIKTARKTLPLPRSVHGHCEPKNWYSLAPCQFCFCINTNKLVCNTADFYVNKLQLGKYNLNICGKDIIKEAIDLIPSDHSLRYGLDKKRIATTTATTPVPGTQMYPKTTTKSTAVNNLPVVVREVITHKKLEDQGDSTEYYDTQEIKLDNPKSNVALPVAKTDNFHYDVNNRNSLVNNKNDDYDDEDYNDSLSRYANVKATNVNPAINVDKIIINVDKANKSSRAPPKALRENEENFVLDVFVPNVLESLFNMQMRKSMLKIDPKSDCTPGETETIGCNTCFCLNNGKKLCTNKVCE